MAASAEQVAMEVRAAHTSELWLQDALRRHRQALMQLLTLVEAVDLTTPAGITKASQDLLQASQRARAVLDDLAWRGNV